jgi:hypothetical protein
MTWKEKKIGSMTFHYLYLGKCQVAQVIQSQARPDCGWQLFLRMEGLTTYGRGSVRTAKADAEEAVEQWLIKSGLQQISRA